MWLFKARRDLSDRASWPPLVSDKRRMEYNEEKQFDYTRLRHALQMLKSVCLLVNEPRKSGLRRGERPSVLVLSSKAAGPEMLREQFMKNCSCSFEQGWLWSGGGLSGRLPPPAWNCWLYPYVCSNCFYNFWQIWNFLQTLRSPFSAVSKPISASK